jgi:DNA-binding transcriptional ArsR family regulator
MNSNIAEEQLMTPAPVEQLDLVFAALADPTRRAILARLAQGEATVNELVTPSDLSQPTISKHLKVLEHAGLVSRGREAQFRPVRLNAAPLADADRWLGHYRHFWTESLDRLDTYVKELKRQEGHHGSKRRRR